MSNDPHHAKHAGHGGYERSDISATAIVYFLVGLAIACLLAYFLVRGIYSALEHHFEAEQTPVSPLVTHATKDTRKLPPEYKTDAQGRDYEKYLEKNFPEPQLETDERTELNKIRLHEEDTLSTYDYVDKSAGTVRIPIDRAMELIAQRGLPVRSQSGGDAAPKEAEKAQPEKAQATK